MKSRKALTLFLLALLCHVSFAQDVEGCKEHPMFPTRMSNYLITECSNNFDAAEFWISPDASTTVTKEGTKTFIRYDFNTESGRQKPSVLQILRNYENAAKKIGGGTMYLNADAATAVFKMVKNGKETTWVKVESGGNDSNDFIMLTVLELEAMKQEITSNDILTALNNDGRIALYINFDTGKSDVKPDSQPIIDQISEMLKSNPELKISIEGHTDNVGNSTANKTLSENRATSVKNGLIARGIDNARLSSKGFGQANPISDNMTDEGKAKNRRVEIVKN
jgi:outer membrane protein OmpA-like peptidoglycan-associated protein